ncbi:hypothetical protein HL658_17120 [Azospirillum sp. RWY-5-1]|uniref:Lipoprotein n=1 Tax=Azospirillum oleiclasticum TaxID=2735135 RepID=A0ABX2TBU0_9PROT|nr:hypothetical protein [Azospirillum oleiclasticum]NYZ14280.1 hypothetical protein [Azospirillum oleiclasticum]NYZ21765.1 hypothetical protein [Azospirillum oleiclasticum]
MPRTLIPLLAAGVAALSLAACDTTGSDRSAGTSGSTTRPAAGSTYGTGSSPGSNPATGSSNIPDYADPAANQGVSPPYSPERNPSGNSR